MAGEWYRKTSWTTADQDDFSARLRRCRSDAHRAQYLRIQASHLQLLGTPEMIRAALGLLERVLNEFPEKFELAMTHVQKAECMKALGNPVQALASYRNALQAEREFRNVKTNAWLDFGWLIACNAMVDKYDEALAILKEFMGSLIFPVERFKYFAILAIISNHYSDEVAARDFAKKSLEAVSMKDSGFRYHREVGLVKNADENIIKLLEKIATKQLTA